MSDDQSRQTGLRMPIDRRIGFLDKVLADAVDLYVDHPMRQTWQGGEGGDPYLLEQIYVLEEIEALHLRVDEASRKFMSDFKTAIDNLHCMLEGVRGEVTSDPRYPWANDVTKAVDATLVDGSPGIHGLLVFIRSEERVCPRPRDWQSFWRLLCGPRRIPSSPKPPGPFVLGGWNHSSNNERAMRLREQVLWAGEHSRLEEADNFLRSLPMESWHHLNVRKPIY